MLSNSFILSCIRFWKIKWDGQCIIPELLGEDGVGGQTGFTAKARLKSRVSLTYPHCHLIRKSMGTTLSRGRVTSSSCNCPRTPPLRYLHLGNRLQGQLKAPLYNQCLEKNFIYALCLPVSGARHCRLLQGSAHLHSPWTTATRGASQRYAHAMIPPPFYSAMQPGDVNSSITYHFFILSQDKVVIAEGHTENNCCHAFKAVDPLLPLWPLATNIKHPGRGRRTISEAMETSLPSPHTVHRDVGGSAKDFQTSRVYRKTNTQPSISKANSSESFLSQEGAHWILKFFSSEQFQQEELDVTYIAIQKSADSSGHAYFVLCLLFP